MSELVTLGGEKKFQAMPTKQDLGTPQGSFQNFQQAPFLYMNGSPHPGAWVNAQISQQVCI